MAYAKRYVGGFVDLPSQTTDIDSTFLNAVEAALLKLFDTDPTVDGQVQSWIAASTKFGPALILNKNVDAAAAIAASKLDFSGSNGIIDANVKSNAAIAITKLANIGDATQFLRGDGTWGAPAYQTYVPTWTASGTAPAIGNAAIIARYATIGKLVHAYGRITFGSTSTFGTGNYSFALPVTANANVDLAGAAMLLHSGSIGNALARLGSATTFAAYYGATYLGTSTQAGQLTPWTWANGDQFGWNLLYEAA